MAIIAFWSEEEKETGQTLSMVALSTYMAVEHNYRILNISTNFKDKTLENCYWNESKQLNIKGITDNSSAIGIESGVEGLIKVLKSNRASSNIVANYSNVVFKDNRLDVLASPKATKYEDYLEVAKMYPEIINTANKGYDLVFVDICKRMGLEEKNKILEIADVIIVNVTQKLQIIDKYRELREQNAFFKNNNVLLNIGRYDSFSKYNISNIKKYLGLKRGILAIPYNTLFFESCAEGKTTQLFFSLRTTTVTETDRNKVFFNDISKIAKELVYKLQELQIKM